MALVSNLHTVFGILGCAAGLFFFFAPMITLKRIFANKSIQQFSFIPYLLTLLHCLLSAWYALPYISENNKLLAIGNGVGALIVTIFLLMFMKYVPNEVKNKNKKMNKLFVFLTLVTLIFVAHTSVNRLNGKSRRYFCGLAASTFSVIMYASPLQIMKTVEFMPFFLSLSGFTYAIFWFIFGLLGNDPFVYVCNGCGTVLCALQLIMYHIYRNNKGQKEPLETGVVKPPENATMEMDSEKTPENATMEINFCEIQIVLKSST